ncbi:DUF3253 domain-containing protein [Erythrobacter sp. 3-20A1M]|uniref:DUF3253 domain-containing protein n=1 Tax=Erythrobacter sp. 3-20A1M TaxID=2653850 RepID=UPI001BFBF816|nr:DUF3253 domain-containing protein [Erythrobacter sp. 3-20A1M]QWC56316.1 DUF3253 domain-containing protein [Erythrobacter sp. 3-20A1M]
MSVGGTSDAVLALLAERGAGKTVCPSEVARRIASDGEADWRMAMPLVHTAVDRLIERGAIELTWKGRALPARSGPYRIGHASDST